MKNFDLPDDNINLSFAEKSRRSNIYVFVSIGVMPLVMLIITSINVESQSCSLTATAAMNDTTMLVKQNRARTLSSMWLLIVRDDSKFF